MSRSRVSLVKSLTRMEGVNNALDLVADDIIPKLHGTVIIKPNLGCGVIPKQKAATHVEALRAVLQFVFSRGKPDRVVLAEGGQDATLKYGLFGYAELEKEFPVHFFDINHETRWLPLQLQGLRGDRLSAGMSRTVLEANCRISVALPKTHDLVVTSLSLKNMMGCLNRQECKYMHGIRAGMWWHRWIPAGLRRVVNEIAPTTGKAIRRGISHLQLASTKVTGADCDPRYLSLPGQRPVSMVSQLSHILSTNLAILGGALAPDVSVIDGTTGLEGEGPTAGDPVNCGLALASADFLAADSTAARMMGFDPHQIQYLHLLAQTNSGAIAQHDIEVLGLDLQQHTQKFRPHPDIAGQLTWYLEQGRGVASWLGR